MTDDGKMLAMIYYPDMVYIYDDRTKTYTKLNSQLKDKEKNYTVHLSRDGKYIVMTGGRTVRIYCFEEKPVVLPVREWTSADGKKKLKAAPFAYDGNDITLTMPDGSTKTSPIGLFSNDDREWCESNRSVLAHNAALSIREWTSADGKKKMKATAVSYDGTEITLSSADGTVKTFPISLFSTKDQDWCKNNREFLE